MDKTSRLFDRWAKTGRSEEMEKGHGTTVNKFLDKLIPFIKEASELHDEKKYIVNKLVNLTVEEWRPICELTYESQQYYNMNKKMEGNYF